MNLTKNKVSFGRGTKSIDQITNAGMVYFNTSTGEIYLNGVAYGGNFKNLDDALIESGVFDPTNNTLVLNQKGGEDIVVNLSLASADANGLMSSEDFSKLATLSGDDTVDGSLAKAVKDLSADIVTAKGEAIDAAASHTEGLIGELEEGKTVVEMIEEAAAARSYSIVAADSSELGTLGENVKEAYKLVLDGEDTAAGEWIKVYKDSSIVEIYLGSASDTVDASGVVTKNPAATGETHQHLNYVYLTANGTYELVSVDISNFLAEAEFKNGLEVSGGEVSVKVDAASEDFLSVSADGVKVSGVTAAIEAAEEAAVASSNAYTDDSLSWWEDNAEE